MLAIWLDPRLLANSSSRPAQFITPPGLSYTSFTYTRSPLQNSLFQAVVVSTADMASLPLQHANTVCYVGDFSSLPDHLVSDSIPQRNSEHSSFHSSLRPWTRGPAVHWVSTSIVDTHYVLYLSRYFYTHSGRRFSSQVRSQFPCGQFSKHGRLRRRIIQCENRAHFKFREKIVL
jgi:hypothetical protein